MVVVVLYLIYRLIPNEGVVSVELDNIPYDDYARFSSTMTQEYHNKFDELYNKYKISFYNYK